MKAKRQHRNGQALLEGVLVWVVMAILAIFMSVVFLRAGRGRAWQVANQIGEQYSTGQKYGIETSFSSSREESVGSDVAYDDTAGAATSISIVKDALPTGVTFAGLGGVSDTYKKGELQEERFIASIDGPRKTRAEDSFYQSGKYSTGNIFTEGDTELK